MTPEGPALCHAKSFVDIRGDADVVATRIGFASKNVDESLPNAAHTSNQARVAPVQKSLVFASGTRLGRLRLCPEGNGGCGECGVPRCGPPSPLSGFGETAFA